MILIIVAECKGVPSSNLSTFNKLEFFHRLCLKDKENVLTEDIPFQTCLTYSPCSTKPDLC